MQVTYLRRRMARASAPAALASLGRGEFAGYASLFGVADGAGDVVAPGAFARSLRARGVDRVRMLYQHFAHEPIGVWEQIREDGHGLYVRGRLSLDIERGRDVLALLNDGALDGLSIGFRTQRARRDGSRGLRVLTEIELWEISIVTFPLLASSHVTAIGAKAALAGEMRKATKAMRTKFTSPNAGRSLYLTPHSMRGKMERVGGTPLRPPPGAFLATARNAPASPRRGR